MTAHDPSGSTPILITAGKIASIAGVRPPAVSNWKRRHTDFPAEMEEGLYDQSEVVSWLRASGKTVNLPERESDESLVRRLADAARGMLRVDQTPEVLLQLFTLRAAASGKYDRLLPLENVWAELGNQAPERLGSAARSMVDSVGASDPELARALRFSSAVDRLQSSEWARLVKFVDQLGPHSTDWGQASTSLIEGFVKRHSTKGGAYSSGSSLVDLMAALLEPIEGTVYDPACGAATFLASVWKRHSDTITHLYGQEINAQSWRLGFLHLLLQNAPFEFLTGDIMVDDRLWQLRADRVAVEPPFGLHLHSVEQMQGDPRWSLGLPPKSRADLAWVQHVAFHLSDSGVGVVVVPPDALARTSRPERGIRTRMLGADYVDAVVYLPPGMLAASSVPVAILVLQKNRTNRAGRVLFVDARQLGTPQRGGVRKFEPAEIARIGRALQQWREGVLQPQARFTGVGTSQQIGAGGAVLLPNRYISYAEAVTEIDNEPIHPRYRRLVDTVNDCITALPNVNTVRQRFVSVDVADDSSGLTHQRLGELLVDEPLSGIRQHEHREGDPIPYVTTGMVSHGQPVLYDPPNAHTFGHIKGRFVQEGDLLLVTRGIERYGSVPCATVRFNIPAAFAESLIRLRVDQHRVDPNYLRLYLTSRRGASALTAAATGSVISNLRRDALKEVDVYLPDLETQKRAAETMTAIERHQAEFEDTLKALSNLRDTAREGFAAGILVAASFQPEEAQK